MPISRATADHYTWLSFVSSSAGSEHCDAWHLHRTAGLSVIEERMPPGTAETRHLHQHATQFFYVLAGELTLELAGQSHTLSAGTGCSVLPQMPHQVINLGSQEARFLVVSQPPSHGDRLECREVTEEAGSSISGKDNQSKSNA
jgi:mannose-6-phosphate isomerase-like protein (cupin superfamily)